MKKIIPHGATLVPNNATRVFEGIIHDVYQWPQTLFDGSVLTFEMLRRPDTVVIIGIVDNKIIVLEDEQPHRGKKLSFPGGRVDPEDDSTLAAAQRELREETGYSFAQWRLIDVRQPQSKTEWFIHLYLAWELTGSKKPHLDAGERITVSLNDYERVRELSMSGQGYLGGDAAIFEQHATLQEFMGIPPYVGKEIER